MQKRWAWSALLLIWALVSFAEDEKTIWDAAREGDLDRVKTLIEGGVAVDIHTHRKATPLCYASAGGQLDVVKYLLEQGADPNFQKGFYSVKPVIWGLQSGNINIPIFLLKHGAIADDQLFQIALQVNNPEFTQACLEAGAMSAYLFELAKASLKDNAEAMAVLEKAKVKPRPETMVLSDAQMDDVAGSFEHAESGTTINVVRKGAIIEVTDPEGTAYKMEPIAPDQFRSLESDSVRLEGFGRAGMREGFALRKGMNVVQYRQIETLTGNNGLVVDAPPSLSVPASGPVHWPGFRGVDALGNADGSKLPVTWDVEAGTNVRWSAEIPGMGHASPVSWGDRIFVATAVSGSGDNQLDTGLNGNLAASKDTSEHRWILFCLNAKDGSVLWQKEVAKAVPQTARHMKATHANSTPATDGNVVVVLFPTAGLFCFDLDGNQKWHQELGGLNAGWFYDARVQWGFASSPVIYDNMVITQVDVQEGAHIAAYDLTSGERLWRTERDEVSTWSTPALYTGPGRHELITNGTTARGYDPKTGEELWQLGPNSEIIIATPQVVGERIYITAGYPPVKPIYVIKPGSKGTIEVPSGGGESEMVAWSINRGGSYMPTPIIYRGIFYIGHHGGRLAAYNAASGDLIYRARFSQGGAFTGSPIAANGHIYFPTEEGDIYVLKAGNKYEEVAINSMGDLVFTTPAATRDSLLIRTRGKIYALGE